MSGHTSDHICTCDTYQIHSRICFQCEQSFTILMELFHRRINCKKHGFIVCCGYPPYICDICANDGWVGKGGEGGKDHAINTKTGETKWIRQIDQESSEDDTSVF